MCVSACFCFFCTCFILASSLRVCSSFRRSFLFPTSIMGTLGQKCFTSGVHFSGMFSERGRTDKGSQINPAVVPVNWVKTLQITGLKGPIQNTFPICYWVSDADLLHCLHWIEKQHSRTVIELLCKSTAAITYQDCQDCQWRNTWEWRQCLDRRVDAACRSLLDQRYPTGPTPPTTGGNSSQVQHDSGVKFGFYVELMIQTKHTLDKCHRLISSQSSFQW